MKYRTHSDSHLFLVFYEFPKRFLRSRYSRVKVRRRAARSEGQAGLRWDNPIDRRRHTDVCLCMLYAQCKAAESGMVVAGSEILQPRMQQWKFLLWNYVCLYKRLIASEDVPCQIGRSLG